MNFTLKQRKAQRVVGHVLVPFLPNWLGMGSTDWERHVLPAETGSRRTGDIPLAPFKG